MVLNNDSYYRTVQVLSCSETLKAHDAIDSNSVYIFESNSVYLESNSVYLESNSVYLE